MATTRIASGRTTPGSTAWQAYVPSNGRGIYVDIDTTAAQLTGNPVYITSIGGSGNQWATIGASSVYLVTATSFRIYIRWVDYSPLTPAQANGYQWHINWIAMEV
jgi:hypothetical protein